MVTSSAVIEDYGKAEPLLLIEVAESSLRYDLEIKAPLYAEASLPEYWVVDLVARELVVFRGPVDGIYREQSVYRASDRIRPLAWHDVIIEVSELFPTLDAA